MIVRIKFRYGFYLFSLITETFTPGNIQENFDCEWAEVEFESSFTPARGLSVSS